MDFATRAKVPASASIRIAASVVLILVSAFNVQAAPGTAAGVSPRVTPVEGPGNLHRLGIALDSSDMGQTGVWGPPPGQYEGPPTGFIEPNRQQFVLSGEDIYRLSCRGCHKADGQGEPPEIPSVVGPVQATSATVMMNRMKALGRSIDLGFARQLAAGSETDLLNRLKHGGQKMPAFAYLDADEVHALIGYLEVLAKVPNSRDAAGVQTSAFRTGELLVKGTCHICHDATGTWPSPEQLLRGAIPPISGFTTMKTPPQFLWKVRHGAPIVMGRLPLLYRGRMPVFGYVSNSEAMAAYLYLVHDPPGSEVPGRGAADQVRAKKTP